MKTLKNSIGLIALGLIVLGTMWFSLSKVFGDTSLFQPTSHNTYSSYTFFASTSPQTSYATTTSATSTDITTWTNSSDGTIDHGYFVIAGAKHVNLTFQRTGNSGNQGSSAFRIQVAASSTATWYDYNTLILNQATTTANLTALGTYTLTGTTTVTTYMRDLGFYAVRCIVVRTTDGEQYCSAAADF